MNEATGDAALTFSASGCAYGHIAGASMLYFGQLSPNGRILRVVAVTISRPRLLEQLGGIETFRHRLAEIVERRFSSRRRPSLLDVDQVDSEVRAANYRQYAAQSLRTACDDDTAVLVFYESRLGLAEPQDEESGRPLLRVVMTPLLLQTLLEHIEVIEQ